MRRHRILGGVDSDLRQVAMWVDEHVCPAVALEGHRPNARQAELYAKGASKIKKDGPHNSYPSRALDMSPDPIPERWGGFPEPDEDGRVDLEEVKVAAKHLAKFYYLAGAMKARAASVDLDLRWGGDWDGDGDFLDNGFDDLVHYEVQ
jgi:peptidoglycan L-alanyl-D-glutamate endopeptidase CwlK